MSDIEDVFDRPAFNQTAVKLLLDNVRMVKENTTRAVSSLETVLYLIRPMEKGDSLKYILGVCTCQCLDRFFFLLSKNGNANLITAMSVCSAHRQIRIDSLASNFRIFNRATVTVHNTGDWRGTQFSLCFNILQCVWPVRSDHLLAAIWNLFGQFRCTWRFLYATKRTSLPTGCHGMLL